MIEAETLTPARPLAHGAGLVSALLRGTAGLGPLSAAEPEDAAEALLTNQPQGSKVAVAFDSECQSELNRFRMELRHLKGRAFELGLSRLATLVSIICRVKPVETVNDLHRNYIAWNGFFENFAIDRSLDLRREYWRILALTQDIAADAGIAPRRLMPMWLSICAESGGDGLYPGSYLRIALTGLRKLPLGAEFDANEDFALHGLARWAAARRPSKSDFMREWQLLEGDFPRSADFWEGRVEAAITATERETSERTHHVRRTFDAAAWWREDVQLGQMSHKPSGASAQPLPLQRTTDVIRSISRPYKSIKNQIDRLIRDQKRYADVTGDVFFLVRTACNVGMRLIQKAPIGETQERGEAALRLAQLAFAYDPANVFAWSLYRDALAAANRLEDAELVGWEAIRRFPEDEQWRTQLATVLTERLQRPEEAAALLKESITLFPGHAHARTQLATILAEFLQRPEEAAALLKETIALFPGNAHARNQLATILADDLGRIEEARQVLQMANNADASNNATQTLLAKLLKNRPLRGKRSLPADQPVASLPQSLSLPAAMARRALFRVEHGFMSREDAAHLLATMPADPYVTYAAARAGDGDVPDTTFSLAFEVAARKGSAAALRALLARARPIERFLLDHAIAAIEDSALPPANDACGDGVASRMMNIVPMFTGPHPPAPAQRLLLLHDLSASLISVALVA